MTFWPKAAHVRALFIACVMIVGLAPGVISAQASSTQPNLLSQFLLRRLLRRVSRVACMAR